MSNHRAETGLVAGENFAPGTFGCHEALHAASIVGDMVDNCLLEHPAIEAVPEWKALAEQASDALHRLYQVIGGRHLGGAE